MKTSNLVHSNLQCLAHLPLSCNEARLFMVIRIFKELEFLTMHRIAVVKY